eukprot:2118577-Pleurochrysis_carterae.AAC.1
MHSCSKQRRASSKDLLWHSHWRWNWNFITEKGRCAFIALLPAEYDGLQRMLDLAVKKQQAKALRSTCDITVRGAPYLLLAPAPAPHNRLRSDTKRPI